MVPTYINEPLTYHLKKNLPIGQIVKVPFRKSEKLGIILGKNIRFQGKYTVKEISQVLPFSITSKQIEFVEWMQNYTMASLGMIAKMILPFNDIKEEKFNIPEYVCDSVKHIAHEQEIKSPKQLTTESYLRVHHSQEQKTALIALRKEAKKNRTILLDGVTGSGKTEVYLSLTEDYISKEKKVLILLPEIALTEQVIQRVTERFGVKPYVWHSSVTPKNKKIAWQAVQKKSPCIVIGARSALMLPFHDLGLIIVDEEHDGSYKQESLVYYHARDMAVTKAHFEKIACLLVSATPSLESFYNATHLKKYGYVQLTNRFGKAQYPTVETTSVKLNESLISATLKDAIAETLSEKRQALLFLNRRGYAPVLMCEKCGYKLKCARCCVSLVLHQKDKTLKCHYCGHNEKMKVHQCPKHGVLYPWGPGVERVAQEARLFFPKAKILVITSDHMSSVKKLKEALYQIKGKEVDIIIGTQMLAKGHHFPFLTLVGIIDGDMGLSGIDLRSSEKTYQLLHQVAGRSGREQDPGRVIIQTASSQHPVMQALLNWDRDSFFKYEIEHRQKTKMPPFGYLAGILISCKNMYTVKNYLQELLYLKPNSQNINVYGPVPAPLSYIKGEFRYRFLLQTDYSSFHLQHYISSWLLPIKCPSTVKQIIDINPQNFF